MFHTVAKSGHPCSQPPTVVVWQWGREKELDGEQKSLENILRGMLLPGGWIPRE